MKAKELYVLDQLRKLGVHASSDGTPVALMSYRELKYLLATRRAVAE